MKKLRILVRSDASLIIGTGNVVRCMALATSLKNDGHTVHFYSQNLPGNMNDWIQQQGFNVFPSGPTDGDYDLCIVDHYALTAEDEDVLRGQSKKIVAIDDWGDRKHRVDLLIDPSISSGSVHRKNSNIGTPFFYGAEWLMIRDEFRDARTRSKTRSSFKSILIFFGGTDPQLQILPYMVCAKEMNHKLKHLELNFLISNYHPQIKNILALNLESNMKIHVAPASLSNLLNQCDFYLGSSGTITWERMCLGLPGMTVAIVDNQEDVAKTLNEMKLQLHLGQSQKIKPEFAFEKMLDALAQPQELTRMSAGAMELVDGLGVLRVKSRLYEFYK